MAFFPFAVHIIFQRIRVVERVAGNYLLMSSSLNRHHHYCHVHRFSPPGRCQSRTWINGRSNNEDWRMIRCASLCNYNITKKDILLTMTLMRYKSRSSSDVINNEITCEKCSASYIAYNSISAEEEGVELSKVVSCPKCGALQRIARVGLPNYFQILGQSRRYRVNAREMSNKARQLQKQFHPDLYSQKGEDQQELSQEYSSLINKALSTLSDPMSRGRYMLTLSGMPLVDSGSDLERSITKDPEFLEEVMELNWRLEEIDSEKEWTEFRNQNEETMKEIILELEKAFDTDDLEKAKRLLGRLKYFDTLQHKLKELQTKIGVVD